MLRNSYFVLRHEDGVALGSICVGEPPRGGGRGAGRGHRRFLRAPLPGRRDNRRDYTLLYIWRGADGAASDSHRRDAI